MSRFKLHLPRPASVIALAALFLALGGSALAVGERVHSTVVAQQRCANGAVRGIAVVAGDPGAGIANVPDRFSANPKLFRRAFNCTGRATQVRRLAIGVYEVRFVGNAATTALAGGASSGSYAGVELVAAGVFRVSVYPAGIGDAEDRPFAIVAF